MLYEVDIARRYLHVGAIMRFYGGMIILAALWAGLYFGLIHVVQWLGGLLFAQPPTGSYSALWDREDHIYRINLLAAGLGLLILLIAVGFISRWNRAALAVAAAAAVLLLLAQRFAVHSGMLNDMEELSLPLLAATGYLPASLLRFSLRVPFITVLTSTSMFGVALGVASIIVVLSVMNGFEKDFHHKILGVKSHLVAANPRGIHHWERAMELLGEIENVRSVHPTVEGLGLVQANRQTRSVLIRGMDPSTEAADAFLRKAVVVGDLDELRGGMGPIFLEEEDVLVDIDELEPAAVPVFLGGELARGLFHIYLPEKVTDEERRQRLSLALGQSVRLVAADMSGAGGDIAPRTVVGRVVGVFASMFHDIDANMLMVNLDTAQHLYGLRGDINRIEVRVGDFAPEPTNRTAWDAQMALNEHLDEAVSLQTWMDMDPIFYESLVLERRMMGLILSIIILVASCNILTTLVMVVMEKTSDIGILRALGASRHSVMGIFVSQGMLIGAFGTASGCLLAIVTCYFIQWFELTIPGGGAVYYIDRLPVKMEFAYFFNVVTFTLTLSFIATLYPAFRASRMAPVEAIRYE